jgi:MGT family glycosyltransferase
LSHVGIVCPNMSGHVNPMIALADSLRKDGHRVTFFLLGDLPASIGQAGFEMVPLGGKAFPVEEYRHASETLGTLQGRAALKHTFGMGLRSAEAILQEGPDLIGKSGVEALVVDQASTPAGTIADELGLPFATVCNALLLNPGPTVPPFFTHWHPTKSWWSQIRNKIFWAGLGRLYSPILKKIQSRRKELGLSIPSSITDAWSTRLQISQQPQVFEFPRNDLPKHLRFVGPLRLKGGDSDIPFPWERLDGRPLIYSSFGTLQNRIHSNFQKVAEACSGLGAQLVLSTGKGIPAKSLGDLPGNPIVVDYAPQRELLKRATMVVTHAGLNTVLDALSAGVPMVAMPVTNEQPGIAARMSFIGAGESLKNKPLTTSNLRPLIQRVLGNPSYKEAAEKVRASIQLAGGAPRASELLGEALGLTGQAPKQ